MSSSGPSLLATIDAHSGFRDPDLSQKVRRWLRAELRNAQFARLEQAGHVDSQLSLALVFTDLAAGAQPWPRGEQTQEGDPLPPGLLAELLQAEPGERAVPRMPAEGPAELSNRRGFLLIGGPGQGKSTITQFLGQVHRAAVLEGEIAQADDPFAEVDREIAKWVAWRLEEDRLPGPKRVRIPAKLSVPELAAWLDHHADTEPTRAVIGFLCAHIGRAQEDPAGMIPDVDVQTLLGLVPWLIIFDGLDEVPVSGGQHLVIEAIEAFVRYLTAERADVLLLATTRPQGYRDDLSAELDPRHLYPLSPQRALTYALRLVTSRYVGDEERQDRILERLARAAGEPLTARLMTSPLQVTIMAALVDRYGRPPHQRWRLFHDYYQVVYEREIERPHSSVAQLLRDHRTHIEEIHYQVGLLLQVESERRGGAQALLDEEQFQKLIEARLEQDEFSAPLRRELAQRIREAAVERLVFLVALQQDGFGFELRSLQEFMAAEALMNGKDEDVLRRLEAIAGLNFWINVFLFAAGKAFAERRHLRDSIVAMCQKINQDPDDAAQRETLIGSHVALSILEDDSVDAPRHANQLASLAAELVDLPLPTTVLTRLAHLAHSSGSVHDALKQILSREHSPEHPTHWVLLSELITAGFDWARTIADECWPEDPAKRIGVAGVIFLNTELPNPWLAEKVSSHLDTFSPVLLERFAKVRATRTTALTPLPVPLAIPVPPLGDSVAIVIDVNESLPAMILLNGWKIVPPDKLQRAMGDAESAPSAWQPWFSTQRFHRQPNRETLADELERLASACDRDTWQWWSSHVPWPLGGCLAAAETPHDLQSLAGEIRAGRYGDASDWEAIVETWQGRPPASLDMLLDTTTEWPFFGLIARSFLFDTMERAPLEWWSLLEQYRSEDTPPRRRLLARILAHGIATSRNQRIPAIPDDPDAVLRRMAAAVDPEFLADLVEESGILMSKLGLALYMLAWSPSDSQERWQRAAERWIAEEPFRRFDLYDLGPDVVDRIARDYDHEPDRTALVRILARLAAHGHKGDVRAEMLAADRFSEASPRFAARLVFWSQDQATPEDFDAWYEQTDGPISAALSPAARMELLGVLIHLRPDSPLRQHGLLRLWRDTPVGDWDYRRAVHDALTWSVVSRASGLDDDAAWYQLALDAPSPRAVLGPPRTSTGAEPLARSRRDSAAPNIPVIQRIRLLDVRLFDKLELIVELPPGPAQDGRWLVLLGENGVGKSTILRSLVLGLAEPTIAHALLGSSRAPLIRRGKAEATIEVTVNGVPYSTRLRAEDTGERPATDKNGAPRPLVFAYGCARGSAIGGADREVSYAPIDHVVTLFDESEPLISAETWLKLLRLNALSRKGKDEGIFQTVEATLRGILPGVDSIDVDGDNVWFSGDAVGDRVPLTGLSDGYITTIGWTCDLLARWVHRADKRGDPIEPGFNQRMRGLVLVDEIDLHLHPRWQRDVIGIVREAFPRMSFVVTTHNPLTLLGTRPGEVQVLQRDGDGGAVRAVPMDLPKGIRADQILTGQWFGLVSTLDSETIDLLEQHRRFLRDGIPPSHPSRQQVDDELKKRLDGFPGTSIEQLSRQVAAEVLDESYPKRTADEKAALRDKFKTMLARRLQQRES